MQQQPGRESLSFPDMATIAQFFLQSQLLIRENLIPWPLIVVQECFCSPNRSFLFLPNRIPSIFFPTLCFFFFSCFSFLRIVCRRIVYDKASCWVTSSLKPCVTRTSLSPAQSPPSSLFLFDNYPFLEVQMHRVGPALVHSWDSSSISGSHRGFDEAKAYGTIVTTSLTRNTRGPHTNHKGCTQLTNFLSYTFLGIYQVLDG